MRDALVILGPIYLFMLSPLLIPIVTMTTGALSDAVRLRRRQQPARPRARVALAPVD